MIPPYEIMNGRAVLPPGSRTPATPEEVRERFVELFPESLTRQRLYADWVERRAEIRRLYGQGFLEWVSGSFVTGKIDPPDLDVVAWIDLDHFNSLEAEVRQQLSEDLLEGPRVKLRYGCHSFVIPVVDDPNDPRFRKYIYLRGEWDWQWSRDRIAGRKGYLEVWG